MASFTHLNPKGSRFSDGSYGVCYAAAELETAVAETIFHFESFARDSADPVRMEDMRVLVCAVREDFEDVSALPEPQKSQVMDPNSYIAAQAYARPLRDGGAMGVTYPSVRRAGVSGLLSPRTPPGDDRRMSKR